MAHDEKNNEKVTRTDCVADDEKDRLSIEQSPQKIVLKIPLIGNLTLNSQLEAIQKIFCRHK